MADTLTFYTHPMSRGRIARWMLEEIGQPYETVVLDYATTMKAPEYLAINPMGKVPAIKHGDTVVTVDGLCVFREMVQRHVNRFGDMTACKLRIAADVEQDVDGAVVEIHVSKVLRARSGQ